MDETNSSAIKNGDQIRNIRKACEISATLHLQAMCETICEMTELELLDKIKIRSKATLASGWAYPVIIGSGERSTILHAEPTSRQIKKSELVLIDMGVTYGGFTSDITRTWPASGHFTFEQRQIYEIVLAAQKAVISEVRPNQNLSDLHNLAKQKMLKDLVEKNIIEKNQLDQVFPHKTSHWLGKLVHDPYSYLDDHGQPVKLSAGMVFTVEPGLYFDDRFGKYSGIGVRIEDVIVVTDSGCEVLSVVAKEIYEIEELRTKAETDAQTTVRIPGTVK